MLIAPLVANAGRKGDIEPTALRIKREMIFCDSFLTSVPTEARRKGFAQGEGKAIACVRPSGGLQDVASISLFATALPLFCFLVYPLLVRIIEQRRPSLSALMNYQRRRWVLNAVARDTPLDAILSGNLMGSVSFFASTTVLLVLALFAVFGQIDMVIGATVTLQPHISALAVEMHMISILIIFVLAFLSFTLSLRQFNHFCIMLGAVGHGEKSSEDEVTIIAALNSSAARNFNQGLRAYYFAIAMLTWFVSGWLSIVSTLAIIGVLIYREFFSTPRGLVERLRRE